MADSSVYLIAYNKRNDADSIVTLDHKTVKFLYENYGVYVFREYFADGNIETNLNSSELFT